MNRFHEALLPLLYQASHREVRVKSPPGSVVMELEGA